MKTRNPQLKILIRRSAIQKRVSALAAQITRDFRGERVHLVGVLKGACFFLADLARQIDLETSIDFISVSSYPTGTESSGRVRLIKDLEAPITGLNVIVVEDILDTGRTLHYLLRLLRLRKPKELRLAVMLDKPARRVKPVEADYWGFRIPDHFVVGYGLDYNERYRNLNDLCVVRDIAKK
jgi:hypoxanthine phosphoribosyltransferase